MKYLIVGLGNPGAEYANTRHNVGFMVLDQLAVEKDNNFEPSKLGYTAEIKHKGRTLVLLKPTTYMNLSGKAIKHHLTQNKIPVENLLVVTDDLSLPLGRIRLRMKGSAGGHNGLKNTEEFLGNNIYSRLRFGIGDNFSRGRQVDYVLSNFEEKEITDREIMIDLSCKAILDFVSIGISQTMTEYNKRSL